MNNISNILLYYFWLILYVIVENKESLLYSIVYEFMLWIFDSINVITLIFLQKYFEKIIRMYGYKLIKFYLLSKKIFLRII